MNPEKDTQGTENITWPDNEATATEAMSNHPDKEPTSESREKEFDPGQSAEHDYRPIEDEREQHAA